MTGVLAVSFCERKAGSGSVCLDLWSYPDGTYNLVVEHFAETGRVEASFPCSLYQLAGVLQKRPFTMETEEGSVVVEVCTDAVCAEFNSPSGKGSFRHCISIEEYRRAIEALELNTIGYVA